MAHRLCLFLFLLVASSSAMADEKTESLNSIDAFNEEAGQFGNSEVKHYSGNLGLFLQLPTYQLNGETQGIILTYRSQTADPWLAFLSEQVFLHTFDELELVSNTNHHPALVQKFSGLESIDPKHEGYFFKSLFPADKLSTGFYDGQFLLKYRYFESTGPLWLGALFKPLSRLPYLGKFFGVIKQPVEQKIKSTFVLNSASSFYGAGWHLSANRKLVWGKNRLARILGDGSFYLYQSTDDKSFSSEGINQGSIVRVSHGFLFTDLDGATEHYNQQGELTLREDSQKRRTEYWHFSWGGLWKVIDPLGQETVFSYNQQRKLQFILDARGRKTSIVINKNGDLIGATFPDGSQLAFAYDNKHHPIEKTSPRGFKTSYGFDEYGKIISITDTLSAITKYDTAFADGSVNELNKLYSKTESPLMPTGSLFSYFTDSLGQTIKYQFRQIPLVWKTTNPLGRTTTENRDAKGQVIETIQPNGNIISYKYDFQGNREEIYNHGSDTKTKLIYGLGKIMEIKDSQGNKTTFNYDDDASHLLDIINAEGEQTKFTYNEKHQLISRTDPNGAVTTFDYDESGQLSKTTDALGNASQYKYDIYGNLTEISSPAGATQKFEYDLMNRLRAEQNQLGGITLYNYAEAQCDCSSHNLATSTSDPLGNVNRKEYDALGQLTKTIDPLGNETKYEYNKNRKLIKVTDALNRAREFIYDEVNQLIQINEPNDTRIKFSYDELGKLKSLTDGKDHTTRFDYDLAGRMKSETDAENKSTSYEYDQLNQLIKTSNPDGSQVSYNYDKAGRLVERRGNSNIASHNIPSPLEGEGQGEGENLAREDLTRFTYQNGQLTKAENEDAIIQRKYDPLNRLLEETTKINNGPTHTINYQYQAEHLIQTNYADQQISYSYSPSSTLQEIKSKTDRVIFNHDTLGRRTKMTVNEKLIKTYQYDQNSRLTELNYTWGKQNIFFEHLSYNAINNIIKKEEEAGTTSYDYDKINQLTQAQGPKETEQFYYDQAGNHLFDPNNPATYSATNAITSNPANQSTFEHDSLGRMIQTKEPNKTMDLAWNTRSQLKTAVVDGRPVKYLYDPFGRRIGKIFEDGKTEYYGHSFEDIVAVYKGEKLNHHYLHGPGIDEPILAGAGAGKNIYASDHLGSIRNTLTETGHKIAGSDYDAFGKLYTDSKNSSKIISKVYSYTGREWDDETGSYYYRRRNYNPLEMRFITPDPISADAHYNLYAYVMGNPISNKDPLGLWRTGIHDMLISTAFGKAGGLELNVNEQEILKRASVFVDTDQSLAGSYKHAMRAPGQTVAEAQSLYEQFLLKNLNESVNLARCLNREGAIFFLGKGLHAIMDSTSPAHTGFQVWHGLDGIRNKADAAAHFAKEASISPEESESTVTLMRNYYRQFLNQIQ